jgi:hypothetical protein
VSAHPFGRLPSQSSNRAKINTDLFHPTRFWRRRDIRRTPAARRLGQERRIAYMLAFSPSCAVRRYALVGGATFISTPFPPRSSCEPERDQGKARRFSPFHRRLESQLRAFRPAGALTSRAQRRRSGRATSHPYRRMGHRMDHHTSQCRMEVTFQVASFAQRRKSLLRHTLSLNNKARRRAASGHLQKRAKGVEPSTFTLAT